MHKSRIKATRERLVGDKWDHDGEVNSENVEKCGWWRYDLKMSN